MLHSDFQYSLMIINEYNKNYNFSFFSVKKTPFIQKCQLNRSLYLMYLIISNFFKRGVSSLLHSFVFIFNYTYIA